MEGFDETTFIAVKKCDRTCVQSQLLKNGTMPQVDSVLRWYSEAWPLRPQNVNLNKTRRDRRKQSGMWMKAVEGGEEEHARCSWLIWGLWFVGLWSQIKMSSLRMLLWNGTSVIHARLMTASSRHCETCSPPKRCHSPSPGDCPRMPFPQWESLFTCEKLWRTSHL